MENITPQLKSALENRWTGWNNAPVIGNQVRNNVYPPMTSAPLFQPICNRLDWLNKEYREAYMEATVEQNIAWQIALNRKERKMSQSALAKAAKTRQSVISRYEDPSYGRHSITALVNIAHVFECALSIKFIPYSELAIESSKTGKECMLVKSFYQEKNLIEGQAT